MTMHFTSSFGSLAALCVASCVMSAPPVATSFHTGAEGWTVADLNCSNYAQVIGPGTITWVASGGSPGAFIRSTDPTSACYSYDSPAAFEGNRSEYVGGSLRWRIRTNIADWLPGSVLILLGGGLVIVADVPQPATGVWIPYEVALEPAFFRLNDTSGAVVTPAQFASVMGNLTSIRISAEFGAQAGEETVDLDSVELIGTCPLDLNGNGAVDAPDLAILLGSWGSTSDLVSDVDYSGLVDASDLAVLLGAWGPCP